MKHLTAPVMQHVPRFCRWRHLSVSSRWSVPSRIRVSSDPARRSLFPRRWDPSAADPISPSPSPSPLRCKSTQQMPQTPCAANLISPSSCSSPLHSNLHHLRNARITVVGCNVGLSISVQLDLVMTCTSAPVSTSQPCMAKTQSALRHSTYELFKLSKWIRSTSHE